MTRVDMTNQPPVSRLYCIHCIALVSSKLGCFQNSQCLPHTFNDLEFGVV
jgi:hypothetical protein